MKRDLLIATVLALAVALWLAERAGHDQARTQALSSTGLLNTAPEDFRRVTGPRPLDFPTDHALHPGYRNEWWYFTGNLADSEGRRYGFQYTLFRFALDDSGRSPASAVSDFDTDAVWMAHLALSDIGNQGFFSHERFAREALGLAGATAELWWLRDWEVRRHPDGWRLRAGFDDLMLDLDLRPAKPVVLQGDAGYSRKGPEPGNASRYYSITRIEAEGSLMIGDRESAVEGLAWLDREWGSSQLGEGLDGWDWFALQLDDGRDLMVYRLRTDGDRASPFSAGVLVEANGEYQVLGRENFALQPVRRWRDREGVSWPVDWQIQVPGHELDLTIRATFDRQRWYATVGYWEGAVEILDTGQQRVGRGYLELSGYADAATPVD